MSVGEILGWSSGAVLLILAMVKIKPIEINPWQHMAKKIGRAINSEVLLEITEIKKQQQITQFELDKHIQDDDERDANMHRQRILQFNNELVRGGDYTQEYFNDMLRDIDEYEAFCLSHPGYKNNCAGMAIANIKRVYSEHEKDGGFLV